MRGAEFLNLCGDGHFCVKWNPEGVVNFNARFVLPRVLTPCRDNG